MGQIGQNRIDEALAACDRERDARQRQKRGPVRQLLSLPPQASAATRVSQGPSTRPTSRRAPTLTASHANGPAARPTDRATQLLGQQQANLLQDLLRYYVWQGADELHSAGLPIKTLDLIRQNDATDG